GARVETGAELARHPFAEDPGCGGYQLAKLHERPAELLEGAPQRPREGMLRDGTAQEPASGEAVEVSRRDPERLERAAPELPAGRTGKREGGWAGGVGHAGEGSGRGLHER